ncbi:MAG: hypothetical protein LUH18_08855 [Oscillospiraceae bacterium]|nr:hypothetical protein [Oscillospiraceae bacterium]
MKRKISAVILSLCLILCTMAGMTTTVAGDHEHTLTYYPREESTCIKPGCIAVWYCATCDIRYTDAAGTNKISAIDMILPLDPDNHEDEPTITDSVPATCTEDGSYTYYYSCCYAINPILYTEIVYATGHTPDGEGTVTRAATCTETGEITYTCSVCSETYTESIPATGNHTAGEAAVENNVPATCTEDGSYDSVVYCSVCEAEISREIITVPATGHSYVDTVTAPTCTEQGYTTHKCSVCDYSYVDTYTTALGHSYESVVTAPTCTEGGYTTYTCSACGDTYTADETEANGHSYEAVVTAPTCTEGGYTTYTCSVCGDTYTADETEALGHTESEAVKENEIAATCTTDGSYESVVYCSVCGEELSRQTMVGELATGHSHEFTEFIWADDLLSATALYTCHCGDTETVDATVTMQGNSGIYTLTATVTDKGGVVHTDTRTAGVNLSTIQADYSAVTSAVARANSLTASNYTNFDIVTAAINSVNWNLSVLNQSSVNTYAEAIETAISDLVPVDSGEVDITEPIEGTDTETEPEGEEQEIPAESNPTTGIAVAMLPITVAVAGAIWGKPLRHG